MPLGQKILGWWVDRVQEATLQSPVVTEAFYRVAQLVDPPTALFAPRVLWEVVRLSMGSPKPTAQLTVATPPAGCS
jgi:hypothetical protein